MNTVLHNIFWLAAGVIGSFIVIKLIGRRASKTSDKTVDIPAGDDKKENENTTIPSAKEAFLSNIDKFGDILPQLNNSLNIELWTEQIVDIDNPQLTALWKRCLKDVAVWKRTLSAWGLRQDTCKSFTYLGKYVNMYETADNSDPEENCKYRVIDGCWILTDDYSGVKRVIKKGIIEKL